MKTSPRIKALANWGGKSNPMIPNSHWHWDETHTFNTYADAGMLYYFPPIVKTRSGNVEMLSQVTDPNAEEIFDTRAFGPTIADVPVSTIPFNPA